MELTKQDYQSALEIYNDWSIDYHIKLSFPEYMEEKIDELEEQKLKTPMYKCIQVPQNTTRDFTLGKLYINSWFIGFYLSDLPFHFELIEPEPEPEKITWQEVVTLIEGFKRTTFLPQGFYMELMKIINRIKTDHL